MLTLADLRDPSKFETVKGLVTFKPHKRTMRLPGHAEPVNIEVKPGDIADILANAKRLEADGYFPRVTDGHVNTQPDFPETDQPPLVGFMSNPHVVSHNGESCIAYDYHMRPECRGVLKERPNRSAEYAFTKNTIRGAALLLRDPALDMGTLHYSLSPDLVYHYGVNSMPEIEKKEEKPGGDEPKTAGEEGIVKKVIEALLVAFPGLSTLAAPAAPPAAPPMAAPPGAGGVAPYQSQGEILLYSQVQALQGTVLALTQANETGACVNLVNDLIVARYDIDAQFELATVQSLPKEKRTAYLANLRRRSKQLPGANPIPVLQGNLDYSAMTPDAPKDHAGSMTKAQADQAVRVARERGISASEAKQLVLGGKA